MADLLLEKLRECVGESNVLTDADAMSSYLVDWRGRYRGTARAVVRPSSTSEVSSVVRACHEARVGMVPQGGNTGLCGGATPRDGEDVVVVSMARMRTIRRVDAADNSLVAEAGCTLAAVQAAADAHERLFPLSLASEGSCMIGGNIATNAGGVHVLRYGSMRQLVLGLEVVLPDGAVLDCLRSLMKDNTGYDLRQLFIGAEGTLGIVTAAVLKLFPRPQQRAVAWLSIEDPQTAITLLNALRQRFGERVSAFELVGRNALQLVLEHIQGARAPLTSVSEWAVLLELADVDATAPLQAMLEQEIASQFEAGVVLDAAIAANLSQCETLWALRENISEAQRIEGISVKHDISVPVSAIPRFLRAADAALQHDFPDIRIVAFGHVGDGNLHYNLSCADPNDNQILIEQTPRLNRLVHDIVAAHDGSISAEHGLGQLKRDEIVRYKSPGELSLMRQIKQTLDPLGLMNPGKLLSESSFGTGA